MSYNNSWSGSIADRRLFRAVAPSLTSLTAAAAGNPWIAATSDSVAIVTDATGSVGRVRLLARDGFSQPAVGQVVEIIVSGGRINSAAINGGAAGGVLVQQNAFAGPLNNAANTGASFIVTPNATTGLVDLSVTFNAATAGATWTVRFRHISAYAAVAVT